MKILTTLLTGVAGAVLVAGAAAAQTADVPSVGAGTLIVSARATGVMPTGDDPILTAAGAATGLNAEVGDDVMPTLGFTYFLTDNWAVEAILGATQHEVRAKGGATDVAVHETWVLPPIVTLQYRPMPNARVSPYIGAGVNYMLFFEGKDRSGFTVDLDDGFGYALQAGADIRIQGPWSLNLDVKKVGFTTDATINGGALTSEVNLDPWVVSVGLARQF